MTHQGFEKFCRVAVLKHVQNTKHPEQEHGINHDKNGHIVHKYDFKAILNFHFEVEQRSYNEVKVRFSLFYYYIVFNLPKKNSKFQKLIFFFFLFYFSIFFFSFLPGCT